MSSSPEFDRDSHTDDESNNNQLLDLNFPETDVTLVVEGRKIHVSKAVVLSQHSPVFQAMFSGHFKESTQKEVLLQDKRYQDVVEFLRCFYPNMKHDVTESNVLQVLPLAHEYQSPLVADCEKLMTNVCKQGTGLTVTSLLDYIIAAEKYDLKTLFCVAIKFCACVDYGLLNGMLFTRVFDSVKNRYVFKITVDESISAKFKTIVPETRLTIAENRIKFLEMNKRWKNNNDPYMEDFSLMLSKESSQ